MSWFDRILPPRIKRAEGSGKGKVPEGLRLKCPECDAVLYSTDLEQNQNVCPKCDHHMRIKARTRLDLLLDPDNRQEIGVQITPQDPLKFKDLRKYPDRISESVAKSGESEALIVMSGTILSQPAVVACFEFEFMGGLG